MQDLSLERLIAGADEVKDLNIFISLDEAWLKQHLSEQSGREGLLTGRAVVIKDNINVSGLPQTCGSRFLENYVSPYDATVVKKLRDAGAVIIGKVNMDEFAMGGSNEYSAYGAVKNPVDRNRVPGGSSGGSAAAVASGLVDHALGSDTGGSIRQPAAYTGIVGLKPTYGRVSRYGLTAFASSFDQIGPLTRTVRQNAELLQVIAGHDRNDSTSLDVPVDDYISGLEDIVVDDIRIGVPFNLLEKGLDDNVREAFECSLDSLRKGGFRVENVDLPYVHYGIAAYYILATAEASSNLARFDGVRYGRREKKEHGDLLDFFSANREQGFGEEVKRRIMLGTYVLSSGYYDAYYLKAQKVRRLLFDDYRRSFKDLNVIMTPTAPTSAFRIGELNNNPLQMYLNDIFTVSANITGIPALSVPAQVGDKKLPVGLQLSGDLLKEGTLLQLGHWMEKENGNG